MWVPSKKKAIQECYTLENDSAFMYIDMGEQNNGQNNFNFVNKKNNKYV